MKLALVSGGSRGLGLALCQALEADGWTVVAFSRTTAHPRDVALDLSAPAAAAATLARVLEPLAAKQPSELLAIGNAATLTPIGAPEGLEPDAIAEHLATNVAGGIVFIRGVLRAFADTAGPRTLVNISSGAATRPIRGWSLYCASKAAMERFVEVVAAEQADRADGFRLLNISPGVVDTGMQATIRAADPADFPDRAHFRSLKDQGALRDPATVARAILRIVAGRPAGGSRIEVADHLG
ncbi:MAG: SDR family NAD(P)-dependent oxidoreductase [Lysobacteraceae bacterium]